MRKLAISVMCLVGCGGGGGSSIPIGSLSTEFTNTYCDLFVSCGLVDSVALCDTLYLDLFVDPDLIAAVNQGKVIYHGDKARECLDALVGTGCSRSDFLTSRATSPACDATFEGTVGDMGACALDTECISQDCSIPQCLPDTCCQGLCVGGTRPVRPKLGEACTNTSNATRCVDSFCDGTSATCVAYKPVGAACVQSSECMSGSSCRIGVCTMLVATGAACTTATNCLDVGDTCGPAMSCVAVGLAGASCTTPKDCSNIYTCDATSHCVLKPILGQACSATSSCVDRSYCDATTMVCKAPQADGAACTSNRSCTSNHCDGTTNQCSTPAPCL